MSYVDALFDRDKDRIHVVERVDGRREYREYPASYVFYYADLRGKHKSIYGAPVSRFSSRNNKEFRKEVRMHSGKQLYESDINPIFRCLEENYKDQDAKAQSWLEQRGNPYQFNIVDAQGSLGFDLGVTGAPETYLVDAQGIIQYRRVGVVDQRVWDDEFKVLYEQLVGKEK